VPFSQNINPGTAGTIRVFSQQYRGRRTATASTSGSSVTLTPTAGAPGSPSAAFRPGETVLVSVPATVKSTGGAAAVPYVYQFTAAATGGTGSFGG
ncbi:Ig-like domain-containing protein, partial [Hymenobacter sp. UV11]